MRLLTSRAIVFALSSSFASPTTPAQKVLHLAIAIAAAAAAAIAIAAAAAAAAAAVVVVAAMAAAVYDVCRRRAITPFFCSLSVGSRAHQRSRARARVCSTFMFDDRQLKVAVCRSPSFVSLFVDSHSIMKMLGAAYFRNESPFYFFISFFERRRDAQSERGRRMLPQIAAFISARK